MSERTFKAYNDAQLIAKRLELTEAVNSVNGPTKAARNSHTGFLLESGNKSNKELRQSLKDCRTEVWERGQGVDGYPPSQICLDLEPNDPRREKVMRVQTMHSPGNGIIGGGFAPGGWI